MREMIRILGKSICILIVGGFAGAVLLILAYMLPVNTENRDASFDVIHQEGEYPRASMSLPTVYDNFVFYATDRLDGFTDETMLQTAMNLEDRSPLLQAMSSYSENKGEYSYYWHGYVTLLRPLLLIFDISSLRMFNCMCQLALLTVLLLLIGREKGFPYAAMLLTSYFLLMPMALFMALQYSWVFYVAAISTLVLLKKKDFLFSGKRIIYFFIIVGMFTSYFDLLTYPLFTWGMPLVWWLVMEDTYDKRTGWCRKVVISGLSWIAGYAGMWMLKWSMASIVLKRNIYQSAIDEVLFRSGTTGEMENYQLADRLRVFYTNWMHYEHVVFVILLVIWALYWAWKSLRHGWRCSPKGHAYLLIGLSSFVWYFVLVNHTAVHHHFTYRIFGVTLLAILALINDGVVHERVSPTIGTRLKVLAIWAACFLLAFPLAMSHREDLSVMNGEEEYRKILLEQGETLEVPFTPTFNQIKNLGLGLESVGGTGEYEISLWDGDRLKYRLSIPVWNSEEGHYKGFDVDWKLNHKKTYRLTIAVHDNPNDTNVWVTTGSMPLAEYGELRVGDSAMPGQMLTGIVYWCRPLEKSNFLFLVFSWMCALAAVSLTVLSPWLQESGKVVC
ncbi:MAG: hypothetical protein J1E01_10310 [Acetatifactor sp.]|nr:hypothetical protein [Acetatifactor sp.]